VHRQLTERPPSAVEEAGVVIDVGEADPHGNLEGADAGEVVLSYPSPDSLTREREEVHRVLAHAGTGTEPLVILLEAAEELTDEELAVALEGAARAERPVILRVIRNG
jgi:hypothetical protein